MSQPNESLASRRRMARAKTAITDAMAEFLEREPTAEHLTATEWLQVLHACNAFLLDTLLNDLWAEMEFKADRKKHRNGEQN